MPDASLLTQALSVGAAPVASPAELRSRAAFLALLWALSYPGRIQELPSDAAGASPDTRSALLTVAETVLDLETSFFTPDDALAGLLARSGARALPAHEAAYHFYPALDARTLDLVAQARVGSYLYPDQAATLILGCRLSKGTRLLLQGPGIAGQAELLVDGLPSALWALRAEKASYPLGWDIFLVDGTRVAGLPRTTVLRPLEPVPGENAPAGKGA